MISTEKGLDYIESVLKDVVDENAAQGKKGDFVRITFTLPRALAEQIDEERQRRVSTPASASTIIREAVAVYLRLRSEVQDHRHRSAWARGKGVDPDNDWMWKRG